MALTITKSASITSWDSTPIVEVTTGEGAGGFLKSVNDTVTGPLLGTVGDIYRFCRIPTNAKLKRVGLVVTTACTAGAADIDVAFSDSTVDGTPQSLATLTNPVVLLTGSADNKLFGSAKSLATVIAVDTDVTFAGTAFTFTPAHQNLPLWQVLVNLGATQFTADPGGYFDIAMKLTAVPTTPSPVIGIKVDYVE
jgi:hypothetical protein